MARSEPLFIFAININSILAKLIFLANIKLTNIIYMSLSIGIVGLPNVGKSTLFNVLTKNTAEAANYPFCTIDPNIGIVKVPDKRLEMLAEISKPKKTIHTTIEFVDIAGLVAGAHKGEGLGNRFLSHIRECDAICEVIRAFEDDNIIHVDGKINPKNDKETINTELVLADLATVEKKMIKVDKEAKSGNKEMIKFKEVLKKIQKHLNQGEAIRNIAFDEEELFLIKTLNLLTIKPILYLINTDDNDKANIEETDTEVLKINAKLEEEISKLSAEEEKEYIQALGLKQTGLDKLITSAYNLLKLVTFFTTGPDETRAWTIKKGTKAPEAAGVIHTDFIKGFIRAEVINYQEFVDAEGESMAREKGLIRTEGKDYIVQDGDVCNFLIGG